MTRQTYATMTRRDLERRIEEQPPDNEDPETGYALVNVLDPDAFEREHIPNSINIPRKRIEEFEKRFGKSKEIIVYCASPECPASLEVAKQLAARGFNNVHDYEKGMSDWKMAGDPVSGNKAA